VTWRPWLEDNALRQMQGLPPEAFDMLVRTLATDPPSRADVSVFSARMLAAIHGGVLHG
jgi:hypothetical protein